MKHNRFFLHLLLLCMILSLLPFPANATDASLDELIINSCTYDQVADITQYKLTKDQLETVYYRLKYEGRLPWYAPNSYTYYYDSSTGYIEEFHPELLGAGYDRLLYEQKIAEVLNACVLDGMAPWQIALAIHDYLIINCIYDESLKLKTGYDLLIKGSTVCSGYASLYQDLLLRAGIPCLQVESEPMNHVWNLVQLDGQWYHVDVTWDDPTPDTKGYVDHRYFLRTDEQMKSAEEPHYDWETDIICTDTKYSDAFWAKSNSHILFTDANTCYYIRDNDLVNSVYKRDVSSGKETRLYKEKEDSVNIGHGNYIYQHTGLSLWNGRLWFCTMKNVYSMNLKGKDLRQEYAYQPESAGRFLAGCYVINDMVEISAADHNGNATTLTHSLEPSGNHVHIYVNTITAPNCTEPGYTTSVCLCGISAKGNIVVPNGHDLERTYYKMATFFTTGYEETICKTCGQTGARELPRIDFVQWFDEYESIIFIVGVVLVCGINEIHKKRKKKRASQAVE